MAEVTVQLEDIANELVEVLPWQFEPRPSERNRPNAALEVYDGSDRRKHLVMPLIIELGKVSQHLKKPFRGTFLKTFYRSVTAMFLVLVIVIIHFRKPILHHAAHHPVKHSSRPMLYVRSDGRMGNQMFQFASLIGLAKSNNMTAIIQADSELWNVFKISGETGYESDLANAAFIEGNRAGVFLEKFTALSQSTIINGFLQSYKYFQNVKAEIIQQHFVFKDNIQRSATEYIAQVLRDKGRPLSKVVGVHVRRGDFVRQIKKGYGVAPRPYLYRTMNYFQRKYDEVVFIVASNDIYWCRDNMVGPYNIHFSKIQDGALDMAVLVNCDDVIITTGSFSWWVGYLNKGITLYYRSYPVDGTWLAALYSKDDYYPPDWIPM